MLYRSTRGDQTVDFASAVLLGLADDGGLFVPTEIPAVDAEVVTQWKSLTYIELAFEIMSLFIPREIIDTEELKEVITNAYGTFSTPEVVQIVTLPSESPDTYLLELFHGPTQAFKDVALQFLGNIFSALLSKRPEGEPDHITIVGATSGDTGAAALAALAGRKGTSCLILYPKGKVSEIQELQMLTYTIGDNVRCGAVEGTFDDCQAIVKRLLGDRKVSEEYGLNLGAINSINFARILAQIVYYAYSALKIATEEKQEVDFCVPTGNFGNALACIYAKRLLASSQSRIGHVVVATNSNDVIPRLVSTGDHHPPATSQATISPAMDISISSNLERLIFDVLDCNADLNKEKYDTRDETIAPGKPVFSLPEQSLAALRKEVIADSCDDEECKKTVRDVFEKSGVLIDTHTAVAVAVSRKVVSRSSDSTSSTDVVVEGQTTSTANPLVIVSTASFGKFRQELRSEDVIPIQVFDENCPVELQINALKEKAYRPAFDVENNDDVVLSILRGFQRDELTGQFVHENSPAVETEGQKPREKRSSWFACC